MGILVLYISNLAFVWGWVELPGGLALVVPLALFLLAFGGRSGRQALNPLQEGGKLQLADSNPPTILGQGSSFDPTQLNTSWKLVDRLKNEISRFRSDTGIRCSLDLCPLPELPEPLWECIFQTVTTGLSNIAEYSQARDVYIRVMPSGKWVEVEVLDNGIGFDPLLATGPLEHYGMLGVQERAQLAGGSLEITSKPGQGTSVRLRLPLVK
jgi:hypothetical protein